MDKKIIAFIVMLLLTAGISLAALLDYYGIIIGTADVSGPEFYIGSIIDKTLLINEKSPNCDSFSIEDSHTNAFETEESLGIINFNYVPKVKFSIRGYVTGDTTTQDLTLKFGYIRDNIPITICTENVSMKKSMDNYTTAFINCSEKPKNADHFFYEFTGNCEGCTYLIQKCFGNFYTKVELSK